MDIFDYRQTADFIASARESGHNLAIDNLSGAKPNNDRASTW
jgi:hypothetical protein